MLVIGAIKRSSSQCRRRQVTKDEEAVNRDEHRWDGDDQRGDHDPEETAVANE